MKTGVGVPFPNVVTTSILTHWAAYDPLGNVCAKLIDGLGTAMGYEGNAGCGVTNEFGTGGPGPTGAHRVSRIEGGPHDAYLYYDARGNQTLRDASNNAYDRTIRYSADSRPFAVIDGYIGAPNKVTRFWHGPDGQRYKRQDATEGKLTYYVGNVEVVKQDGVATFKRTLGVVVLQEVVGAASTDHYLFHDQLGSLVRTTDAQGATVHALDYTALGERRSVADPTRQVASSPALTNRGFTGHEHMDGDVIHMNARLYDPVLAPDSTDR